MWFPWIWGGRVPRPALMHRISAGSPSLLCGAVLRLCAEKKPLSPFIEVNNLFAYWLVAVIVLDGLSLIIDVTDVARYMKGERAPQLTLGD